MRRVLLFFALPVLAGCGENAPTTELQIMSAGSVITADSTDALLSALAGQRIYFAHQSVGSNVVAGLERLGREQPDAEFRTVLTRDPELLTQAPAFVHFLAGRNGDPESKNADFIRMLDQRPTRDRGIAMLKYCYIDAASPMSAEEIFASYQRTIATVRERNPDIRIVHVTMPLTTVETGARATVKRALGRIEDNRAVAVKRHRFNELMRQAYSSREPLFDIAALEAVRPDGSRSFFVADGDTIPAMARELTWDGGHLNEVGQRRAAEALVQLLARVAAVR